MAKGEQRVDESGCELDVFTFCLYHGKSQLFDDGSKRHEKHATYGKDGVNICRWEAARKKAAQMQEQCTHLDIREKMALLRKRTKGAKVPIKFERCVGR